MTLDTPYAISYTYHALAMSGNLGMLRHMLEQAGPSSSGPIVNHYDHMGITPLHRAIEEGHGDVVELLIEFGADPEKAIDDDEGFPPMYLAVITHHSQIAIALIEAGVDVNQTSKVGYCALHEAARLGDKRVARSLLDNGADCNAVGPDDSTPLCWAVLQSHLPVARVLLEAGADPDWAGIGHLQWPDPSFRMAPICSSAAAGQTEMIELLLQHGADPGARGPGGYSPLHEAAREGKLRMVELLLVAGADPGAVADLDGTTPLWWAEAGNHPKIASLLRRDA